MLKKLMLKKRTLKKLRLIELKLKKSGIRFIALFVAASLMPLVFLPDARAQQTLGGITGTVSDRTGGVLPDTVVTIVGDQTKLTRSLNTNANGSYDFVNLPIGTYTLTFTHVGFRRKGCPRLQSRPIAPRPSI
jgi:hypothetical protein